MDYGYNGDEPQRRQVKTTIRSSAASWMW